VGLPKIAMGQILSTSLGLASAITWPADQSSLDHYFVVGMVLALVARAVFDRRLLGTAPTECSTACCLRRRAACMPSSAGVSSRAETWSSRRQALGHLVYGGLTGWIYRSGVGCEPGHSRDRQRVVPQAAGRVGNRPDGHLDPSSAGRDGSKVAKRYGKAGNWRLSGTQNSAVHRVLSGSGRLSAGS
jgi:hypothetical protein